MDCEADPDSLKRGEPGSNLVGLIEVDVSKAPLGFRIGFMVKNLLYSAVYYLDERLKPVYLF
jgi:hypothetical protein